MENDKAHSWQNDKVVSVPYEKELTVGDLKKMLEGIPDDYELVWSNQFEGVNEWIQTLVEDSLSKTLYFMSEEQMHHLQRSYCSMLLDELQCMM